MKAIATLVSLVALVGATSAAAESFTFTTQSDPVTLITAPGPTAAATMVGAHWTGTTTATFKSGASAVGRYECIGWATPGQATTNSAVCEISENAADKYEVQIACSPMDASKPNGETTCWGALVGASGRYAGRSGSFVQMGNQNVATGQGAWRD